MELSPNIYIFKKGTYIPPYDYIFYENSEIIIVKCIPYPFIDYDEHNNLIYGYITNTIKK